VIRFLADENFDRRIVSALTKRTVQIAVTLAQEAGLTGTRDHALLEWAAQHGLILLTHDGRTIPRFARQRLVRGQPMSGVVIVRKELPISLVIDDLAMIAECSAAYEWEGAVVYLPI